MRTYTRKRPHLQVIDGVEELCRLCLNKTEGGVSIFDQDPSKTSSSMSLNHRIMICVGLEMQQEDCLPNTICTHCYKELQRYYIFRKKCEASYQKLKLHLQTVKEREMNKAAALLLKEKEQNNNDNLKNSGAEDGKLEWEVQIVDDVLVRIPEEVNATDKLSQAMSIGYANNISTTPQKISDLQLQNKSPQQNVSEFLTEMLVELGLLSNQGGELMWTNASMNTIQLETGDGSQFNLVLAEEQDQLPPSSPRVTAEETTRNQIETNNPDKNGIIVKCVTVSNTSNIEARRKENSSVDENACICSVCGKQFVCRSVLTRHQRVHSGERPYACRHCPRRFAQRAVLQRHELLHTDPSSRPFRCAECPKTFTQRSGLAAHARSHAPPYARPLPLHRCNRCTKVFLHPSGLSRHMMMHKGRIYNCGTCGKGFVDKSSLQRHIKNSHRGQAVSDTVQQLEGV